MAILERTISMIAQWAKNAKTAIPTTKAQNTAYRNTNLTTTQIEDGQGFDSQIDSPNYNQRDWLITGLLMQLEQYGILPYSKITNYDTNSLCLGVNGIIYQAVTPSGPANGGAKATNTVAWKDYTEFIFNKLFNEAIKPTEQTINNYKTPLGNIQLLPFRVTSLPFGYYFCNGDNYLLSGKQGQVLNSLPATYKTDFNITITGTVPNQNINVPNMFYSDGRGYFIRAINGTSRLVGSIQLDNFKSHTHTYPGGNWTGNNYSSVIQGASTHQFTYTLYAAGGSETMPINIGFMPCIFLGV